jgi:transposase
VARCARRLSWKETAAAFRTTWERFSTRWNTSSLSGLEHRVLGQIEAIGVDEIQYKGHKYLTLVYQIDLGVTRLPWVGRERTIESFRGLFTVIGDDLASKTCSSAPTCGDPYLKVIREKCFEALHILDRFHIVAKMNEALDEVRAGSGPGSIQEPVSWPRRIAATGLWSLRLRHGLRHGALAVLCAAEIRRCHLAHFLLCVAAGEDGNAART